MNIDALTMKEPLLRWYNKSHRELPWRNTSDPYKIWISEIMLQQTRVEAVKGYYERFLNEIPDIATLAEIEEERLLKLWEGLGYYNRARNLQKAARQIMEKHDGVFPCEINEVLALPGIGEYTAGAICSICFGQPTPAVDGNVLRVVMRLLDCYDNIDLLRTKHNIRDWLCPLYGKGDCGMLTQALMELGAVICVPNGAPDCTHCPLACLCLGRERNTYSQLPVKQAKKPRAVEEKTVFVLHEGTRYGIQKRPAGGLLANMWEFYHVPGLLSEQEAVDYISGQGFEPVMLEKMIPYTHVFSHVEWRMRAYFISCQNQNQNLIWVEREDMEKQYALPTAYKTFLEKESKV